MVSGLLTRAAALVFSSIVALTSVSAGSPPALSAHDLPIFFFHGINSNAASGNVLKANLSTDARLFVGLSFCETICTLSDLNTQAQLAIKQIRNYTASDARFDKGYVFVAHSLGGAVARAVIEEMDDHKVHTFISLAGAVNGISYGPQESDVVPGQIFLKNYAPVFYSTSVFDYTKYTVDDIKTGKLQVAVAQLLADKPELQVTAGTQLVRSPVEAPWISYSGFFPGVNNLKPATTDAIKADQARRKKNFLKLQEAHFFASPFDETVAPWQSAQLAQYNAVASIEEYAANFSKLKIVPMAETTEYTKDTYGLQTLDKRGGLFFHTFENVPHSGWLRDTTSPRDGKVYAFAPVYEKGLYPLLAPRAESPTPTPTPTTISPKPAC